MNRGFSRAEHTPKLVAAPLYFDVAFMVWAAVGSLAIFIAEDLRLGPADPPSCRPRHHRLAAPTIVGPRWPRRATLVPHKARGARRPPAISSKDA